MAFFSVRRVFYLLAALPLLLSACRKHEQEPPYYQFTADDQRWLQHRKGDEWRFENGRGQQRVYRVTEIVQELKIDCCYAPAAALPVPGKRQADRYSDSWRMYVQRVDSAGSGGSFSFHRPIVLPPNQPDEAAVVEDALGGQGYWNEYIGDVVPARGLRCFDLDFRSATSVTSLPHTALTVRGQQYAYVLTFSAGGSPGSCASPSVPLPRMNRIYYDRQYGIVRMESVTGEVWDRVR